MEKISKNTTLMDLYKESILSGRTCSRCLKQNIRTVGDLIKWLAFNPDSKILKETELDNISRYVNIKDIEVIKSDDLYLLNNNRHISSKTLSFFNKLRITSVSELVPFCYLDYPSFEKIFQADIDVYNEINDIIYKKAKKFGEKHIRIKKKDISCLLDLLSKFREISSTYGKITPKTKIAKLYNLSYISNRTSNCCTENAIYEVRDLMFWKSRNDSFTDIPNLGEKSNLELIAVLLSLWEHRTKAKTTVHTNVKDCDKDIVNNTIDNLDSGTEDNTKKINLEFSFSINQISYKTLSTKAIRRSSLYTVKVQTEIDTNKSIKHIPYINYYLEDPVNRYEMISNKEEMQFHYMNPSINIVLNRDTNSGEIYRIKEILLTSLLRYIYSLIPEVYLVDLFNHHKRSSTENQQKSITFKDFYSKHIKTNKELLRLYDSYKILFEDIIRLDEKEACKRLIYEFFSFLDEENINFVVDFVLEYIDIPFLRILYNYYMSCNDRTANIIKEYVADFFASNEKVNLDRIADNQGVTTSYVRIIINNAIEGSKKKQITDIIHKCISFVHSGSYADYILRPNIIFEDDENIRNIICKEAIQCNTTDIFGTLFYFSANSEFTRINSRNILISTRYQYLLKDIIKFYQDCITKWKRLSDKRIDLEEYLDEQEDNYKDSYSLLLKLAFGNLYNENSKILTLPKNTSDIKDEIFKKLDDLGGICSVDVLYTFARSIDDIPNLNTFILRMNKDLRFIADKETIRLSNFFRQKDDVKKHISWLLEREEVPLPLEILVSWSKLFFKKLNYKNVYSILIEDHNFMYFDGMKFGLTNKLYPRRFLCYKDPDTSSIKLSAASNDINPLLSFIINNGYCPVRGGIRVYEKLLPYERVDEIFIDVDDDIHNDDDYDIYDDTTINNDIPSTQTTEENALGSREKFDYQYDKERIDLKNYNLENQSLLNYVKKSGIPQHIDEYNFIFKWEGHRLFLKYRNEINRELKNIDKLIISMFWRFYDIYMYKYNKSSDIIKLDINKTYKFFDKYCGDIVNVNSLHH